MRFSILYVSAPMKNSILLLANTKPQNMFAQGTSKVAFVVVSRLEKFRLNILFYLGNATAP